MSGNRQHANAENFIESGSNMSASSRTIVELDAKLGRMIDARDLEGIVDLYRADGAFLVPGQPAFEGHDAIRAVWQHFFGLPDFALVLGTPAVSVSSDATFAMDRGTYRLSYRGAQGPVVDVGKYLVVWRTAGDGTWQMAADMFNSDGDPAVQPTQAR